MDPMLRDLGTAVLIMALAWGLSRLAKWVFDMLAKRFIGRTATHLDDALIRATNFPLQAAIIVAGVQFALAFVSAIPSSWEENVERLFFVLYLILIYVFLYRLIGGLIHWYGREVAHRTETELDDKFLHLFQNLAFIGLTIIVIIIILGRYGIEISALVTTLGIGSLAIALAAQATLGDMFAGFTIMIDQPFAVGDRVEILAIDTWGDVIDIGLRSTRILTRDNRMVSVPNSVIGKGLVVNYSDPSTRYRVETHVGVAYGTDLEEARQVMIEAIRAQDWVMKNERIEALFLEFGPSSLNFRVRCWIEHYVETRRIIDKMNTALYQALNEAGIEIPFPQQDVHLVSGLQSAAKISS